VFRRASLCFQTPLRLSQSTWADLHSQISLGVNVPSPSLANLSVYRPSSSFLLGAGLDHRTCPRLMGTSRRIVQFFARERVVAAFRSMNSISVRLDKKIRAQVAFWRFRNATTDAGQYDFKTLRGFFEPKRSSTGPMRMTVFIPTFHLPLELGNGTNENIHSPGSWETGSWAGLLRTSRGRSSSSVNPPSPCGMYFAARSLTLALSWRVTSRVLREFRCLLQRRHAHVDVFGLDRFRRMVQNAVSRPHASRCRRVGIDHDLQQSRNSCSRSLLQARN